MRGIRIQGSRCARLCMVAGALLFAFAAGPVLAGDDETPCFEAASAHYHVPINLLRAIREQEAGWVGLQRRNTNGTYDMGVMQINTLWIPQLARHGYTADVLIHDACASIMAGAWILATNMQRFGTWNREGVTASDYWYSVGAYHSQTPHLNQRYRQLVWSRFARITKEQKALNDQRLEAEKAKVAAASQAAKEPVSESFGQSLWAWFFPDSNS